MLLLYILCIDTNILSLSGPFKINGVPIRRVNQTYVVATSTKIDVSGVNVKKFDDSYFAREKKKKAKKIEGELFEKEEVHSYEQYEARFPFLCNPALHYLEGICLYLSGD